VPHATLELRDRCPLTVGPFKITPYLVDHSAYDAYALEVEAGGRKLFYSGDLRAHGRKAALFERLISNPPPDVDVLLMEGSTLGRLDAGLEFPTESEIEDLFVRLFNRTPGMALVSASAQNIDRIVSLYRACKRADRTLVIDLYAAEILRATGNSSIPQSDWPNVTVFLPHYQRVRIKQTGRFDVLDPHKTNRVYAEDLSALAPRAAFLFRSAMLADLDRAGCLNQTVAVWSQWAGYLREDRGGQLVDMLKRMGIGIEHAHTSGHAGLGDLKRFAKAIAPRKLVPIHTFEPLQFQDYFGSMVHQLDDGEWLEISE
jgi:ribonuclease J